MKMQRSAYRQKIFYIIPYPIVPLIGPCFRCLRQAQAARKSGYEVYIISPRLVNGKETAKLIDPIFDGLHIMPVLPCSPTPLVREISLLLFSWGLLSKTLNTYRPQVVHVHNPPDTLAFIVSVLCSRRNIPVVYDIHDTSREVIAASDFPHLLKMLFTTVGDFFEAQTIKRSSGIVTVSESMSKLLLETRPVLKKRKPSMIIQRNIEDLEEYQSLQPSDGQDSYMFYSGTLYARFLGLDFFIESVKDVFARYDVKLYIAGDGPLKPYLEKAIKGHHLAERVICLGCIPKKEVIRYIKGALLTIIPYRRNSLTEIALPRKLFEYMAMGKPVVYPDLPGFREVLGTNNEGKYIPDDNDDLRRVTDRLLGDSLLRKKVGELNKKLLHDISFEKEFSYLLDLYDAVLRE